MGLFGRHVKPRERVADALPYQELNPDGTVLTKDWGLMKVWYVQYPDSAMDTVSCDEISDRIARTFQQHEDDQKVTKIAYWFVMERIPMTVVVDPMISGADNMHDADLEIELHRNDIFSDSSRNMLNRNFAVCKCEVKLESTGITEKSRKHAENVFINFESTLRTINARPIALTCDGEGPCSIMDFLKYMTGTDLAEYQCPENGMGNLSDYLSTKFMQKGQPMVYGDKYLQALTINSFPSRTYPNILVGLLALPFCFRWVTRWIPRNNFESQAEAKKMQQAYRSGMKSWKTVFYETSTGKDSGVVEAQAETDVEDMQQVMYDLTTGETIGELTSTVILMDEDIERLKDMVAITKRVISSVGFDAITEDSTSNFPAWKSSLPGDSLSNRRKPWVTASNISHIIPFTDMYHGSNINHFLKSISGVGWPHAIGKLITNELYFLNLNGPKDDVGHTVIVGATGSGKSILLAFLASQWARYPDSRVILFDKDMSFRNLCERTGGAVYIPTAEGSRLSFMPLSRMMTKPSQAVNWLETVIISSNITLTPDISEELMAVCREWDESLPPTVERFTQRLRGYNPMSPALPALQKILDDSDLSKLFGGERDEFNKDSFRRKTMIEMGPLMNLGNEAVLPALQFMFDRMDELFDADPKPSLLILDEAWKFLSHPVFRRKIKEWLKTLRKKNVFVIFALQNISDIDDFEEFLTSCHTEIFLPNSTVREGGSEAIKELYRKMGCSDDEITVIGNAERKSEYFIKQEEGSALVRFDLDGYQLERIARDGR